MTEAPDLNAFNAGVVEEFRANGGTVGGPFEGGTLLLRATPKAHIEIGADAYDVDVRELPDDERAELCPKVTEAAPAFAEYQSRTTRVIPLFELTRT